MTAAPAAEEGGGTDLGTWAARRPGAEAVVIVDPDGARPAERITYAELDASANRLARVLRRAGLRRDDRVGRTSHPPRRRQAGVRRPPPPAGHPCRRPLPGRGEAADDRLVGEAGKIVKRDLRRALEQPNGG